MDCRESRQLTPILPACWVTMVAIARGRDGWSARSSRFAHHSLTIVDPIISGVLSHKCARYGAAPRSTWSTKTTPRSAPPQPVPGRRRTGAPEAGGCNGARRMPGLRPRSGGGGGGGRGVRPIVPRCLWGGAVFRTFGAGVAVVRWRWCGVSRPLISYPNVTLPALGREGWPGERKADGGEGKVSGHGAVRGPCGLPRQGERRVDAERHLGSPRTALIRGQPNQTRAGCVKLDGPGRRGESGGAKCRSGDRLRFW